MTIAEYIEKEKKKGNNISYSSIARDVPCTPQAISQIAKGVSFPSYQMAKRIEQVTNGAVKKENWYPQ